MSHRILIFGYNKVCRTQCVQHFHDGCAYFAVFCMTTNSLLREDNFIIDGDFKYTARTWNHCPAFYKVFNGTFTQNFVRQTDGSWGVVSRCTISNGDVHESVLHRNMSFLRMFTLKMDIFNITQSHTQIK